MSGSAVVACGADLTGKWDAEVVTDAGSGNPAFEFQQQGTKLTGTYKGLLGEQKLTGTVEGKKVSFTFSGEVEGQAMKVTYEGTLESDTVIKGKVDLGGFASGTFTLTRK